MRKPVVILPPEQSAHIAQDFQQWLWWRHGSQLIARWVAAYPLHGTYADVWNDHFLRTYSDLTWKDRGTPKWNELDTEWIFYGEDEYTDAPKKITVARIIDLLVHAQYEWWEDACKPWGSDISSKPGVIIGTRVVYTATCGPRQRMIILRRDGFACQLCGRSAYHGAQLQVDHVIPRMHGGCTVPWNLWTLCADCNNGKGGQLIGFRPPISSARRDTDFVPGHVMF